MAAAALVTEPATPTPMKVGDCPWLRLTMAEAVAPMAGLSIQARRLLTVGQRTTALIQVLIDAECFIDAINVLAYALERKSAVIWAYECVRTHRGETVSTEERATLEAVLAWLGDTDNDALRREANSRAETMSPRNPTSWVGIAVFWSGGSLAPPDCPPVDAKPELLGTAVKSALHIATAEAEPRAIAPTRERFLAEGLRIANRPQ